jgi:hypothetical protein
MATRPSKRDRDEPSDGQARLQSMFEQGYAPESDVHPKDSAAGSDGVRAEQLLKDIEESVSALRSLYGRARGTAAETRTGRERSARSV